MKVNLATFEEVHYPVYVLEEQRLRDNLKLMLVRPMLRLF